MADSLVSTQSVTRSYNGGRLTALADVTLEIAPSEYVVITGPSGSGKSTLLHLLCGIDHPTSGEVRFEGRLPATPGEWRRLRARRIGLVFQSFNLLPRLTAAENVEVPMFGLVSRASQRRQRAIHLLGRVGLADRTAHRPNELSGGEQQRLAIARSLANSPGLLLADEPTGNLDSKSSSEILALLEELRRERGATLVIVTHDPQIAQRAQRILRMMDGRLRSDMGREN